MAAPFAAFLILGGLDASRASAQGTVRSETPTQAAACASQTRPPSELSPALALATFDTAWSLIHTRHFDTTFNGVNWRALREELRPRAEAARDVGALRSVLRDMLARLAQSHFSIIPSEASPVDREHEGAAGDAGISIRMMSGAAIVTDVEPGSAAATAGIAPGAEVIAIDGCLVATLARVPTDVMGERTARLRARSLVEHRLDGAAGTMVRVLVDDGRGARREVLLERQAPSGQTVRFGNFPPITAALDARRIEAAPGIPVAVIRFNAWFPVLAVQLDAAIEAHRDAAAIIIDLRGNGGGLGAMVMGVAGHFLTEPRALGIMRTRDGEMRFVSNPRRVNAAGSRVEPLAVPLAILVDEGTGSTSEMFAGGLQALGRARIIGDTTAGHVLPAVMQRLPNDDVLYHAIADFVLPEGTRLEGRGVIPDILAPATRPSLLAGRDAALDAALRWIVTEARVP